MFISSFIKVGSWFKKLGQIRVSNDKFAKLNNPEGIEVWFSAVKLVFIYIKYIQDQFWYLLESWRFWDFWWFRVFFKKPKLGILTNSNSFSPSKGSNLFIMIYEYFLDKYI